MYARMVPYKSFDYKLTQNARKKPNVKEKSGSGGLGPTLEYSLLV